MNNPEQQSNTGSNLQTPESEMALTKQEIEEFRKLSIEEQEGRKNDMVNNLNSLQSKLDQAIQDAIKSGDMQTAQHLKTELEEKLRELEEIDNIIPSSTPTPEDEEIFNEIRRYEFDNIPKLRVLTDEMAERLGHYTLGLNFNSVTFLSDTAAQFFSQLGGGWINLNELHSISNQAAKYLSENEAGIGLNNLKSISDVALEYFSHHKGWVSLEGLTSISDTGAQLLAKHQGKVILNDTIQAVVDKFKK